jgi:RecB family exonuclease
VPQIDQALDEIAASRERDPLAPVTVIVPSHIAGIQLRRRLAELTPFAAVRFETMPRLAELIGAGALAAEGRAPLARPIGDYIATLVAAESRGPLAALQEMPGYARVLRQIFRRLRRAGLHDGSEYTPQPVSGHLPELLRLFSRFRERTSRFYDEEDLLEAAARRLTNRQTSLVDELGTVYVLPPGAESAGAATFLAALATVTQSHMVEDSQPAARPRFILAPDPATDAREAVREVLAALESGLGLHEVAVFHGADRAYPRLLREAFAAAGIPAALMPGTPLSETATGRAVLQLARLPAEDYARAAVMDFLELAAVRRELPTSDGRVTPAPTAWQKLSRGAGVTHGLERWRRGLGSFLADNQAELANPDLDDWRRDALGRDRKRASDLLAFVEELASRLGALAAAQPAEAFIERFKAVVSAYVHPSAEHLDEVVAEIDQLGTVAAVGGSFSLESFLAALEANLRIATTRETSLGQGVFVGDYRLAAGLSFRHVVLCGAFEGALPAGPGLDALVEDSVWSEMRKKFPFIEDAAFRTERATRAADRAVAAAGKGTVVWSAPLYEAGGSRDYYPSPPMVEAAASSQPAIRTATALREAPASAVLRRGASPLSILITGPVVDQFEAGLRDAVQKHQQGIAPGPGHQYEPGLRLLRARRSAAFTEYDGNLAALAANGHFALGRVSPTSLEDYATCGFRYLCKSVLRLNVVDEPADRETMDAGARGSLVHNILERFFRDQKARGRPAPGERWNAADIDRLLLIADEELARARQRGLTGLDIYAEHELRNIKADLAAFLEEDSAFRMETGAVPAEFEVAIPEVELAGLMLRGYADRIDRTPDGRAAWVIDYKTGSSSSYKDILRDPLKGGTKLQLPAYMIAANAEQVQALYWFITRRGDFERIGFTSSPPVMERYEATLAAIVASIQAGAFPAVSGEDHDLPRGFENCRYCDFNKLCSRRRDIELKEKADDAALAPWFEIARVAST